MLQEKKFYITYTFCITWFIIHDTFVMAEQQKNRNKTLFIVENGYDPKLPVFNTGSVHKTYDLYSCTQI